MWRKGCHKYRLDSAGPTVTEAVEFISLNEWAKRVGVSKDSAYRRARAGEIPGCFSLGRLYRVNWGAFVASTVPLGA